MERLGLNIFKLNFALIFSSVIDSFNEYIKAETLDGDNKYDAGEHGLQVSIIYSVEHSFLRNPYRL